MRTPIKTYEIPVTWRSRGVFRVPANSLTEAIDKVEDGAPGFELVPTYAECIDDSLEIDQDQLKRLNFETIWVTVLTTDHKWHEVELNVPDDQDKETWVKEALNVRYPNNVSRIIYD